MLGKLSRLIGAISVALVFCISGFAQDATEQKKRTAPSLDGTSGLFKTWDAEPLRQSEFNFSLGFSHYNRDPGELIIKTVPVGVAVGLLDRLEFFGSMDVQKRVETLSSRTYRVLPGQPPQPATTLLGAPFFSNEAPFIDVPRANGHGDVRLGLKINLLSERIGNPLGTSIVGFSKLAGQRSATGINRGLSNGAYEAGFGGLFSKRAGKIAQLHLNTLFNFVIDPELQVGAGQHLQLADLQNSFVYRIGAGFPTYGMVQAITELEGTAYFGSRTAGLNPTNPVDFIAGVRVYPKDWISFGAGYRASFNHVDENAANRIFPAATNGFVAQVGFGRRRNDPPTVTCVVANPSIKQDDKTTIRANAVDPDHDTLSYSWTSSGGKLEGSGDTVSFDATGVAPGKYTVTGTVSDGRHQVPCTTDITVIKRNLPPTVSTEPASVTITEGETATIRAMASDPNNDSLTYTWTVDGQPVAAPSSTMAFGSEGRKPGTYKVTVTVSDGELTATSTSTVTVVEKVKPNQPPAIECLSQSVDVASGGSIELRVRTSDPDGDRVTTSWSATGGSVSGTGDTASFNAGGVSAGTYTVTASADDGRGGRTSCNMTVNVSETIVLIREGKVPCGNFAVGSARVDNCAKAMLDDLALRMKNDPKLRANIIGYTDSSRRERSMKNLGTRRARAVADYLQKKGVDSTRFTVTDGGDNKPAGDNKTAAGRARNRRVEIELSVR